jgi:hypothetical protein
LTETWLLAQQQHQSSRTHGNSNNIRKKQLQKSPQDKQEEKMKKETRTRRTLELAMRASRNIYPTKKKNNPSREQTTRKTKPMKTKIKCMGWRNKAGKK